MGDQESVFGYDLRFELPIYIVLSHQRSLKIVFIIEDLGKALD